jgi:hypothetical protein
VPGSDPEDVPLALRLATLTTKILQDVITELNFPFLPSELHHFTSLDVAVKIIDEDDVRLSHAEYSNDPNEMEEAKRIIAEQLNSRSADEPFFDQVPENYKQLSSKLDAYIFCTMSEPLVPPDILSHWRAYGRDGRGICLKLDAKALSHLVYNTPRLRINPVIYDRETQRRFVDSILNKAREFHQRGEPNADKAAVAALAFATPLMKAPGFMEEKEWRLMFTPPEAGIAARLDFHSRRDFLAPYIKLKHVYDDLRPEMMKIPELAATVPQAELCPTPPPKLVPIKKVMIGPSGHQSLNERAFVKAIRQAGREVEILGSQIPYRSLT